MPFDPQQVTRVARLARLRLAPEEVSRHAGELARILELVEQMNAADTSGLEPMAHPIAGCQRLRADRVSETDQRERLQAGAPAARDGLYLVPRVVE